MGVTNAHVTLTARHPWVDDMKYGPITNSSDSLTNLEFRIYAFWTTKKLFYFELLKLRKIHVKQIGKNIRCFYQFV